MSTVSTTLLSVGPKSLHPWGDRAWRVGLTAQYCTGSSSDYWLVTPTQPAAYKVTQDTVVVPSPDHEGVLDSIIFLLALHLGNAQLEGFLLDHHNIHVTAGVREVAEYWELTAATRGHLGKALAEHYRIGVTVLDDCSLVDPAIVGDLRRLGFDVDVFLLADSSVVA